MNNACPVPSAAERHYGHSLSDVQSVLSSKVTDAIDEAHRMAASAFAASGLTGSPPVRDYFAAWLHQQLYCEICGADPHTFAGGKAETALAVIHNYQDIARHHWGAGSTTFHGSDVRPDSGEDAT